MELTTNQFAVMNMRFTMISGLLPLIGNKKALSAAIKRTAAEYGISKPTVRKYLNLYLEAQDKTVLAPEIRKKETPENEYAADIRWALNKYYYCRDKLSLSEVYTLLIKERFYKDGSLVESRPTYGQFLYYYNKHKSTSNKIITREGLSYYQRNERSLLGDGVQSYASAPGVGMLDSTICDIYIINESGQLIGRPMLTICVDAFSSMLMGYSLGWEGGTFSLRNLMQNIITDKVEHCRSFGIELDEADWNCKDVLSGRFMTDKGAEYASENFSQITELGIQVENLCAYIRDGKLQTEIISQRGKGGCTPKDWDAIDTQYLPLVIDFVASIKAKEDSGERPVRITAYLAAKELGLPNKAFPRLKNCTDYISQFEESREEYWAREIVWAYHYIDAIGDKMQYASFRKLLNVRRSYMVAALPFIKDDSIRMAVGNISEK